MNAQITLNPFREIEALQRQLERELSRSQRETPQVSRPERGRVWESAIEWQETPIAFILRVELPGMSAKDIDVQASRFAVAIAGKRQVERVSNNSRNFRSELRYGRFKRVVQLSKAIVPDRITAELKNGILTLTLPKWEAQQPQVVKLNLGETPSAVKTETEIPEEKPVNAETPQPQSAIGTNDSELLADLWATPA